METAKNRVETHKTEVLKYVEIKEVFTKLETLEGGADMIAIIAGM